MRLDFLCGCVRFACIRAFFFCYYGGDYMFNSKKVRELEWKIMDMQKTIDILLTKMDRHADLLNAYEDNLNYLVEKRVLNESLVAAMKFGINLRENNFLTSKKEIDDYFTK